MAYALLGTCGRCGSCSAAVRTAIEFMRDLLERGSYRRTPNPQCRRACSTSASPTPEQIPREEPVIVLSRHCGPGDTLLVAWLLNIHYRLQLRIVLKAVLRCEPVLDFAGDLGCLCFLRHEVRKPRKQIHDLAASLCTAGRRCCCSLRAGTSPGRGGQLRFSDSARLVGSAKPAVPGDSRIRCPRAPAAPRRRCPERPAQVSSCSPTRVSPRTGGPGPGGACPCTGGCWSARFWCPPPSFPRPIS